MTEWRSNVWLGIELLIVSVVLWFIAAWFYGVIRIYTRDLGFDIEHCYLLTVNNADPNNPKFVERDNEYRATSEDMAEILDRLQHHPIVEAASLSQNSYPYNGSNSGLSFWTPDGLRTQGYVVRRDVSADFVRVFRYRGVNGETPEELAALLAKGDYLISNRSLLDAHDNKIDMSGRGSFQIYTSEDTTRLRTIGAVVVPPRYSDYQTFDATLLRKLARRRFCDANEVCIRVKPEADRDVRETLMADAETLFHVGNKMLVDVTPFGEVRDSFLRTMTQTVRSMGVGMMFLLVNVFLGLFGTFWFRTRQRVSEVAIRLSFGATPGGVFRRLLAEGLVILLLVTPLAFAIDCLLCHLGLNQFMDADDWGAAALAACITFVVMALMIVAGVWFPASRAAAIDPAKALKDE